MVLTATVLDRPILRRLLPGFLRVQGRPSRTVSGVQAGARYPVPLGTVYLEPSKPHEAVDDLDDLQYATWEDAEWQ